MDITANPFLVEAGLSQGSWEETVSPDGFGVSIGLSASPEIQVSPPGFGVPVTILGDPKIAVNPYECPIVAGLSGVPYLYFFPSKFDVSSGLSATLDIALPPGETGIIGYRVYSGNNVLLATVHRSLNILDQLGLIAGQTYAYRLAAYDYLGAESDKTDVVSLLLDFLVQISDYLDLFTPQYQNSTKLLQFADALFQKLNDNIALYGRFGAETFLSTAIGNQLDVIGVIVGQSRTLPFQPTDGSSPILDDDTYRILLRAKIAINHWDGQIATIEEGWTTIFPGTTITVQDNQNMTMSAWIEGEFSQLLKDMVEFDMIIPRPQGVGIIMNWDTRIDKSFAYDLSNGEFDGYDVGYWNYVE